jgi:hypothetical protein
MLKQLDTLIKQIQPKIIKAEADKEYFKGALDAFLLVKEMLNEPEIKPNQPVRETEKETT